MNSLKTTYSKVFAKCKNDVNKKLRMKKKQVLAIKNLIMILGPKFSHLVYTASVPRGSAAGALG